MRKELEKLEGYRGTFIGTFERFGEKSSYRGLPLKTVLLTNIKDINGKIVSDHLWFNFTKGFEKVNLKPGDVVRFVARVKEYEKGYKGYRDDVYNPISYDYKLSHPSQIMKIG